MKALTIWQPWAWLIAEGHKRIETRSWPTHYRGKLLIHAAKHTISKKDLWGWDRMLSHRHRIIIWENSLQYGGIIAEAQLVDCVPVSQLTKLTSQEKAFGNYNEGRYGWILDDVKPVEFIPCNGQQGLWTPNNPFQLSIEGI